MLSLKEKISLVLLTAAYLVCAFRYFPGRLFESLVETASHILGSVPFIIGLTLLIFSFFKKMTGSKLSWDRTFRIFLTLGIIFEVFYGLYNLHGPS
ncbi:MAG: hypothetical protein KKA70_10500 [Proteobacteria bacterium]|nr:hypothetical protein [Pseudomonadota bacterium]MBU1716369.1 hypothetical protein [Pseudomonadota bacterium]